MDLKNVGIALLVLGPAVAVAQDAGTDAAVEEYAQILRDMQSLEAYNALISRQIAMQESDLQDLQTAMEQVPDLERQLPPLLINMINGLDEFVERDLPFFSQERADRIADLYLLVEDPKATDAQKLRRILEAWSIEAEYGNYSQTESGEINLPGVGERSVDFVKLGRVALLFQTDDDDAITGAWDPESRDWVILGNEHRNPVRQAIRMARTQIAPDLLLLPIPSPQAQ